MAETKESQMLGGRGGLPSSSASTALAASASGRGNSDRAAAEASLNENIELKEEVYEEFGPGRKRRRVAPSRGVINTMGAPTKIKSTTQPILQQGNVILNGHVSFRMPAFRAEHDKKCRAMGFPPSEFPGGGPNVHNILNRELLFRSVARLDSDRKWITRSIGNGSSNLWSSFNFLPRDEEPIFVGIADTPVIMNQQTGQAQTDGLSVAIAGTRTLDIGNEVAHLGDTLYWEFPTTLERMGNPELRRPGQEIKGKPSDKYLATLKPLSFEDTGSSNLFRNVASRWIAGAYNPNPVEYPHFQTYENLERLLETYAADFNDEKHHPYDGLNAEGSNVDDARPTNTLEVICETIAKIQGYQTDTLMAQQKELLLGEHRNLYKQMKRTHYASKRITKQSIVRLIQLQIDYARQQHVNFHLKRRVGMALETGRNQGIGVYVRGGISA